MYGDGVFGLVEQHAVVADAQTQQSFELASQRLHPALAGKQGQPELRAFCDCLWLLPQSSSKECKLICRFKRKGSDAFFASFFATRKRAWKIRLPPLPLMIY
jgi:hypothetical protein